MASIQKIFLLSCCTLLMTSYASSKKQQYYETHNNKTIEFVSDFSDTAERDSYPPTTIETTIETTSTSQTAKSKLSTTKSNQSPNPMNSEEAITEVNNNGGNSSSVQHFKMEGDEKHFSSTLLPDTLISTSTTTKFTDESSKMSNSRNIRQVDKTSERAQNNNLGSNIANTTSINSTTTKSDSNATTGVTNSTSVTNEPTLLPNKVTIKPTNVSTNATKSRKKFWTSFKYTVAGAVGVVGVFIWAYYIINGVY